MGARNEDRRLILQLVDQINDRDGWRTRRCGDHITAFPPEKQKVIMIPTSPGDYRWRKNVRSELRRAGMKDSVLE